MDLDSFLSTSRWDILQILAKRASSPSEIASEMNTSVSYISQQLKLLEAANLVHKKKTGTIDKGQPRSLYSLSNELLYLTVLSNEWSAKKLLHMQDYHKSMLKIWMIPDIKTHEPISALYWALHNELDSIESIFFQEFPSPKLVVISNNKKVKTILDSFSGAINCSMTPKKEIPKESIVIYRRKND